MPTFEIVCLANSRKRSGRCVAGLRTDGAGWLRPVGSNAEGILHSYHYTLPDNTEARLLDVLRIECSRAHPHPHHPEDWVAMPVLWRLVERPLTVERLDWLRSQLANGPHLLGSPQDRIRAASLQSRPLPHSLALIAPQDLHWIVKPGKEKEAEHRVRACFHLGGTEYNLALTDPLWESRLQPLPLGQHPRHAARLKDTDEVWLTVSVSEPFAPAEGEEEFCFKLVAGVIVVPKASMKGVSAVVGRSAKTAVGSNGERHAVKTRASLPDLSHYPDPFAETEVIATTDAVAVVPACHDINIAPAKKNVTLLQAEHPAAQNGVQAAQNSDRDITPVEEDAPPASRKSAAVFTHATGTIEIKGSGHPAPPAPKMSWRDKIAKMRQTVPRAYMSWSGAEDALLQHLAAEGESVNQIAAQMQRHPGAVRIRLKKYDLLKEEADELTSQAVVHGVSSVSEHPVPEHLLPEPPLPERRDTTQAAQEGKPTETEPAVTAVPQRLSETAIATAPEGQRIQPLAKQTTGAGANDIRVAVCGAAGRMGREVVKAVVEAEGLHLVAAIDVASAGLDAGELAGVGKTGVVVETELEPALLKWKPDVLVDFTLPDSVKRNAIVALENGVAPVIGTTGLSPSDLSTLDALAKEKGIGAFIAPNFAIGAVLAMQFAAQAARYLPDVEIIELHHEKKLDSPSGTALLTAQKIAQARQEAGQTPQPLPANLIEKAPGARGARHATTGDVPIHSVRLPGFVAHQEVIFGGVGEILTIRHDSTNRTSFMPGVLLAVRKVRALSGLVIGLENLLV